MSCGPPWCECGGSPWTPSGSGSRRTTTRSWAWARTPARRISPRRTASWPARSSTRTPTRATPRPRSAFKEISAAYDVVGDTDKRGASTTKSGASARSVAASGPGGAGGPGGFAGGFGVGRRGRRPGRPAGQPLRGSGPRQPGPFRRARARRRPGDRTAPGLRGRRAGRHHLGAPGQRRRVLDLSRLGCGARQRRGRLSASAPAAASSTTTRACSPSSRPCTGAAPARAWSSSDPCPTCAGPGIERRPRTVKARHPRRCHRRAAHRVKGRGGPGAQRRTTRRPVRDRARPAPPAVRPGQGDDLTLRVPLTFTEAALWAPTSRSRHWGASPVTIRIPAGTTSGRTSR